MVSMSYYFGGGCGGCDQIPMVTACRTCCQFFAMADSPHYFSFSPFTFQILVSDIVSDYQVHFGQGKSFTSRVGGQCCRNFEVVNWLEFFGGWGGSAAEILREPNCGQICHIFWVWGGSVSTY